MKKADELRGPSCLTRAADDEPLFVLRANDDLAPNIVREWAHEYLLRKRGNFTPQNSAKFLEALQLALDMERWKRENP
jgi:hypothetical protein